MINPSRSELSLLVEALLVGDTKAVRAQLRDTKSVDVRLPQRKNRPKRETPLMLAAERGCLPIVRLLISLGTNINATNEFRQTALLYAVRENQLSTVNLLLKSGADPNVVMVDGDFVLREAATSSIDLRICRALLKSGADPCSVNKMGGTALHIAAFHGRADVARLLIRAGANVNHRDHHGHGPLTCSISRNHKDVSILLLEHGADPGLQPEALGIAAWEGRLQYVKMLIERGWDVNARSHQGRTPLQHARNRKHKSVISALIDAGAR
ncbi:ankyrin repeat domain-containing protein [Planctomycetaceae bacterium SH139]